METMKQTSALEFDLIYADGTRRRVKEGILYEAEASGDMLFHNGTDQPAVLLAAAECALVSLFLIEPGLEALAMGMALTEESRAVLERLATFAIRLLGSTSTENQACFRLGQMDMRESVAAMLRDTAAQLSGISRAALIAAADAVERMRVME